LPPPRKVVVFTTSWPRTPGDFAGRFVADAVERLRARGLEIEVVAPQLETTGGGLVHLLRRRPWIAPRLFVSMARALRRAARDADLVHVHWLGGALVGALARTPFVVTLHGTGSAGRFHDLALMERWPGLVGALLRRARVVIAVSEPLADAARRCGAHDVRVIPSGVDLPAEIGEEVEPPEILFVGRLSPEKGIHELVQATRGMNLVVAGDGPLRDVVPTLHGFLPHDELQKLYARAALVVLPSFREGLPLSILEAMAHARPVVATPVGGVGALVEDGRTGLLVPPGDPLALRKAIERLLGDRGLRRKLGQAGRQKVEALCSWERVTDATLEAYAAAAAPRT
jgi:glycosyltransferase involved in cell wall biosynthesis